MTTVLRVDCGKTVRADGLLSEKSDVTPNMVRAARQGSSVPSKPAERPLETWRAANGPAEEWQRADPTVMRLVEVTGKRGISVLNLLVSIRPPLSAMLLALALSCAAEAHPEAPQLAPVVDTMPFGKAFGGPFTLTDQDGRQRSDRDFRGRFMLIVFGYTYCPDICPLELSIVAEVLDGLGPDGQKVQPLFVTIDPKRDTTAVLKGYVAQFHPRLIGLTGTEAEIAAVAKAFRVHRQKVVTDPARPDDYLVDHGSFMYLMGPDGTFRTLFPYGAHGDYDQAIERIGGIVRGYLVSG